MKLFTLVTALLMSGAAFAYPALNDSLSTSGTLTTPAGQSFPLTLTLAITEFNAGNQQFKVVTTTSAGGRVDKREEWQQKDQMITRDTVMNVLAQCAAYGGQTETLTTPVGALPTCRIVQENADQHQIVWIADLPFGVAQISQTSKSDGQKLDLTVTSFQNGTP